MSNIAPLAGLTELQELHFYGTSVSDLRPLAGLTELQRLNLYGTPVSDLRPLTGLTELHTLYLWNTQVSVLPSGMMLVTVTGPPSSIWKAAWATSVTAPPRQLPSSPGWIPACSGPSHI